MKKILSIIAILLFGAYVNVYAATATVAVTPSSVKAGENYTVTINLRAAAWNVHAVASGSTESCVIDEASQTNDAEPTNKSFTATCKATTAGTITVTLTGDVTDENGIVKLSETKTITVTAGENPIVTTYTVTFDSNGGSAVASQTVNKDAKATTPTNPTKSGYTFKEWQLNGQAYDFNTPVTSNITLKAVWIDDDPDVTKYTVTFNSDGGSAVNSQTVNENAKATKPANPTKSGYTFKEWQLNGKTYDFSTPVTGNITLKAVWTKNSSGGKNTIKIVVPLKGDDVIKGTPNEETGEIVNKYPVYVTQTGEDEIKSISITIGNKASTVKGNTCEGVSPYEAKTDGDKCTFELPTGQTGKTGKKVLVGYVVVTLSADTEKPFDVINKKVNGAKTGAAFNTLAVVLGLVSVGAISMYVAKKRRMI